MNGNITIKLGTDAVSDHLSRLYLCGAAGEYQHIDQPGSTITVIKHGKATTTVRMTPGAVTELLDDMAYQVEWSTERYQRAYRGQCARALAAVRKQLAADVQPADDPAVTA